MPQEHLLTLNAGSSSVKFALFARAEAALVPVRSGQVDGIGSGGVANHAQALEQILNGLGDVHIGAIGHRVVHGGTRFEAPVRVDDAVLEAVAALSPLAPLHQPHNLAGMVAARQAFAGVPQVACFDTAFHRSMPQINQRFALPQALFDAGVRRYGFHGLSYESIAQQLRDHHPALATGRVVVAHLGNGASLCAMHNGRSVATTMGFSPLDGLPMGTRCGRLDPAVVLHLLHDNSAEQVAHLLYHQSGLLGLSGLSSDMRTLEASPLPQAAMAIDYFVEHVLRETAAMASALRGIDALVFTGGIGENAVALRQRIVQGAAWMGLQPDAEQPVPVLVLRTNGGGHRPTHRAIGLGRSGLSARTATTTPQGTHVQIFIFRARAPTAAGAHTHRRCHHQVHHLLYVRLPLRYSGALA
jgi:acetate kinase